MKELHYATLYGTVHTDRRQKAVYESLRPLDGYLRSALERAREQREAAVCDWEFVEGPNDEHMVADPDRLGRTAARRREQWIQLKAPQGQDGQLFDPRQLFVEEDVREVFVGILPQSRSIRVIGARRDAFRLLLAEAPPTGEPLRLRIQTDALQRQRNALKTLSQTPMPHHEGLHRLLLPTSEIHWPNLVRVSPSRCHLLGDAADRPFDGIEAQQDFVTTALATPDLAILEGPPGSGKTLVICELILQLVERGQRVLLCSSTHVAVDNVLERLIDSDYIGPKIDAVRVGRVDRIDRTIAHLQLDTRSDALVGRWREEATFPDLSDDVLAAMARESVARWADLTCSTTTGIAHHPLIRDATAAGSQPAFDVLILDEASKTTFQEMLVPAIHCRRTIIVGDTAQLSPFSSDRDVEAAISDVRPPLQSGASFTPAFQRACLLLYRLLDPEREMDVPTLIVEPPGVIDALWAELEARDLCVIAAGSRAVSPIRVRLSQTASQTSALAHARDISVAEVSTNPDAGIHLIGASWCFVPDSLLPECEGLLPPDFVHLTPLRTETSLALYRRAGWIATGQGSETLAIEDQDRDQLEGKTFAQEVAWRLGRTQQLEGNRDDSGTNPNRKLDRYRRELFDFMPVRPELAWVEDAVHTIKDIGLRSLLQTLRQGTGRARGNHRKSALVAGLPYLALSERSGLLTHQHRMVPALSAYPRRHFYRNNALHDASSVHARTRSWPMRDVRGNTLPARFWLQVAGTEEQGRNLAEVEAARRLVDSFMANVDGPRPDGHPWEIAILSFYYAQTIQLRDMLRHVTGEKRGETRFSVGPHFELACTTVDRFQGREADFVILSFRNVRHTGHVDSPNRLNVAVTRSRLGLALIGDRRFWSRCRTPELEELATEVPCVELPS